MDPAHRAGRRGGPPRPRRDRRQRRLPLRPLRRPLTVAVPGQPTVTYAYDALDRRASRADGTAAESYTYVGLGATIGRIDRGAGGLLDSAVDASGARLTAGGAWLLPTVRGDVAALLDPSGTSVSDAYRYDPYGLTLASLGSSANPYRFAGRLVEPASGQYDFGSRQYDPALAAFTSLDTAMGGAADPVSLNRYLYAHANPESMIDPDGHAACRLLADECVDRAAISKLTALRVAATAADAAVLAAFTAAERADAVADAALARATEPCRFGEAAVCAAWRHSRTAAANRARTDARTAWANVSAAAGRVAQAHRAIAQAERALAAAREKSGIGTAKAVAAKPDDGGILGGIARGVWNATGGFAVSLVTDFGGTIGGMVEPFAYTATHLDRAPADFAAGVNYMAGEPDSTKAEFAAGIVTGVVFSKKLPSVLPKRTASTAEGIRLPQDIGANPAAPRQLSFTRPISSSASQNGLLQTRISQLRVEGARDFRVNQQQVNASGVRVGVNRPDLQHTLNGQRFYEEFETGSLRAAWDHAPRILANDPLGRFVPWRAP